MDINQQSFSLGILGGTFDPIHLGHLHVALSLYSALGLAEVRLTPCGGPLLRKPPIASAEQRLTMVKIAIENHHGLKVDNREIERGGPSYTIETLRSIRAEIGRRPMMCILGVEQFAQFNQWHDWQQIIELAHLVIVTRAGYDLVWQPEVAKLLKQRQIMDKQLLQQSASGHLMFQSIIPLLISASEIRTKISQGDDPAVFLPAKVWEYIQQQHLYL